MNSRLVFEGCQLDYGSRLKQNPRAKKLTSEGWTFPALSKDDTLSLQDRKRLRQRQIISFREAARRIQVTKKAGTGIVGRLKGRLLVNADLPSRLSEKLSRQFDWTLPKDNRFDDFFNEDDDEEFESSESSSSHAEEGSEEDEILDEQSAICEFATRLDALKDKEADDLTSGIITGLKSWLSFGTSISSAAAGNYCSIGPGPVGEIENRLQSFMSKTEHAVNEAKTRKEGGVVLGKGDDKLTLKAEEQASRIAGEFCLWLRDLPRGLDDSVNTIPEEHIRALFDAGQAVNPAKSKLVEGLRSWVKFGAQVTGRREDIATITKQQINKNRFRKQFQQRKLQKKRRPNWQTSRSKGIETNSSNQPLVAASERMERRKLYGQNVWYLNPDKWQDRFFRVSAEKKSSSTVEAVLASTIPASERPLVSSIERSGVSDILSTPSNSQDGGRSASLRLQSPMLAQRSRRPRKAARQQQPDYALRQEDLARQREAENEKLAQMESTKAFAAFLSSRPNYEPPDFLQQVLPKAAATTSDNDASETARATTTKEQLELSRKKSGTERL